MTLFKNAVVRKGKRRWQDVAEQNPTPWTLRMFGNVVEEHIWEDQPRKKITRDLIWKSADSWTDELGSTALCGTSAKIVALSSKPTSTGSSLQGMVPTP